MLRSAADILISKLCEHSTLSERAIDDLRDVPVEMRTLAPRQDIVRQGDRPHVCVIVVKGMLLRYHTLRNGQRQYLAFHLAGDMPDAQSLFIDIMDHSVCAAGDAMAALMPHDKLHRLARKHIDLAFAVWRETLIDASIFRQAITNNSARAPMTRLAHFLCEVYYRCRAGRHADPGQCELPITQHQLGETLGMSVVTANRALQALRTSNSVDWRDGFIFMLDWPRLAEIGDFDPTYLNLKRPRRL